MPDIYVNGVKQGGPAKKVNVAKVTKQTIPTERIIEDAIKGEGK